MRRSRGFTLVEIVVVLLIFGIVLAMAAAITRGVVASQKRSLTATRLATVDAALVQFVMQQRRLPCPADGTLASTANNAGVELPTGGGACTAMNTGVVPWRALGLSETEVTDGWDRRITYRVDARLTGTGGMDMSWCDPAGTEPDGALPRPCITTCVGTNMNTCTRPIAFLSGKGLTVRSLSTLPPNLPLMDPAAAPGPNTGAAYVLISAGETGGGAYNNNGALMTSITTDGTEEAKNYNNQAIQPYYVDDTTSDAPGVSHFDDVVSRPSILTVASKAGLAPLGH